MNIFDVVTKTVELTGRRFTNEDRSSINKFKADYTALTDEALQDMLHNAVRGVRQNKNYHSTSTFSWLLSFIMRFMHRKSPTTLNNIALAIEAFKRAPADLPPGSQLFPQQIQAAITLTRRCLIQMDTGEGKTYALLPSAFALACEHHQVYIVCANEYLAWRDARRTQPFWEFVGLPPGLCIEGTASSNWSHRIIYTTLEQLVFKHLKNIISEHSPEHHLTFGSILLDEADAILLDQATTTFNLVQNINTAAFDWTYAIDYANTLVEEEDILTDLYTLKAKLTITGEKRLRDNIHTKHNSGLKYLMLRHAVEVAYVATRIVEEGKDYITEGDKIYAIDRISGRVQRNITPRWIVPLEFKKGLPSSPESINLDTISPVTVLNKFQHMSGMSGTIANDALEYLFTYLLPTQVIPPRKKRFNGLLPDQIYMSKKDASSQLCSCALELIEKGRPVLIGTQTIFDAEMLYKALSSILPPDINLRLLTGKNDKEAAEIFEQAGQVGSVVISTQLAGRGVDIRLSEEAKKNGGMVLLSFGHSLTLRYDKQFVGRVGRQGDPFTAIFFCSYDDELLKIFTGERIKRLMEKLGQEEGVGIDSKMVSKRITGVQQNIRQQQFLERRQELGTNTAQEEVRESIEMWFEYLQLPFEDGQASLPSGQSHTASEQCSNAFLDWTINHFVDKNLTSLLKGKKDISEQEAEYISEFINRTLNLINKRRFSPSDIEGLDQATATQEIRTRLLKIMGDSITSYWALRQKVLESGYLGFLFRPESTEEALSLSEGQVHLTNNQIKAIFHRTPRKIAFWSILSSWVEFQQEWSRIIHRARVKSQSILEYYRIITDQTISEWEKREGYISTKVIQSLAHCDQPSALDELFVYDDNIVYTTEPAFDNSYDWHQASPEGNLDLTNVDNIQLLVNYFAEQSIEMLDEDFSKSQLTRLLNDFNRKHPLHTLQTPVQIQRALEDVLAEQIADGVNEERRKKNKKWIRAFLIFLRDRKLVGPLPAFHHHFTSAIAQLFENITETKTAITTVGIIAFIGVYALLTYFGKFCEPKQFDTLGTVVDSILFGSLLSKGAITAPAFGVMIAGILAAGILTSSGISYVRRDRLEGLIVILLQLIFAWWLTRWTYDGFASPLLYVRSVIVFLSIIVIARVTQKVTWWLEHDVGVSLISGWLTYNIAVIFIPLLLSQYANIYLPLICFGAGVLVFNLSHQFNNKEIELVSTRLLNSERSMDVEEISSSIRVEGNCGSLPHIYGILLAWLAYQILSATLSASSPELNRRIITYTPITIYLISTFLWTSLILNKRFSPDLWEKDLNLKSQAIKDAPDSEAIRYKLNDVKKALLWRELLFQGFLIIAVSIVLYDYRLAATWFPLGVLIVFSAYLFGDHSRAFVIQLYRLLFSRLPYRIETLDLSKIKEPEIKLSARVRIKRFFEDRIGLVITIILLMIEGVDFIQKVWEFIGRFKKR